MLVIHDGGDDDLLVAPVTSHVGRSVHDIVLNDWREAGLRLPSIARLEKLATIAKVTVIRSLGQLSSADRGQVNIALQRWFEGVVFSW